MSAIITKKRVCDRCGKELDYPMFKMLVQRPITAIKTRWEDGSPYGYFDNYIELCNECRRGFDDFILQERRSGE